jgi:hypothetical protein
MSVLHDIIPGVIPSQKRDMNVYPSLDRNEAVVKKGKVVPVLN